MKKREEETKGKTKKCRKGDDSKLKWKENGKQTGIGEEKTREMQVEKAKENGKGKRRQEKSQMNLKENEKKND